MVCVQHRHISFEMKIVCVCNIDTLFIVQKFLNYIYIFFYLKKRYGVCN